jgi:hypothetical protein
MSDSSDMRRATRLPVRVYRLGEEPTDDLSGSTTPAERFEMVALLTARMLEFSGQRLPTYSRREMPMRVIRP